MKKEEIILDQKKESKKVTSAPVDLGAARKFVSEATAKFVCSFLDHIPNRSMSWGANGPSLDSVETFANAAGSLMILDTASLPPRKIGSMFNFGASKVQAGSATEVWIVVGPEKEAQVASAYLTKELVDKVVRDKKLALAGATEKRNKEEVARFRVL